MHRPLKRVLVVDDDPDVTAIVSLALTHLGGYTVEVCEAPAEAVEMVRAFDPDLILLDIMMPGLGGLGVLEALRQNRAIGDTPIVFMTAYPDPLAECGTLGCLGVIPKPFDPAILPERLEELWGSHRQKRLEAHQREYETLRRAYIVELVDKMRAMEEAGAALATGGWDRSVVESLSRLAHRMAGSAGLYRLGRLSRSAGAFEGIVNRMLSAPTWPPSMSPADLARLVHAVGVTARSEAAIVTGADPADRETGDDARSHT